jgi:hypothetical protein
MLRNVQIWQQIHNWTMTGVIMLREQICPSRKEVKSRDTTNDWIVNKQQKDSKSSSSSSKGRNWLEVSLVTKSIENNFIDFYRE